MGLGPPLQKYRLMPIQFPLGIKDYILSKYVAFFVDNQISAR